MSYSRINWTDKTPISVDNLNTMDEGIEQNSKAIESLAPAIGALTKSPTDTTGGRQRQLAVAPNESGDGYDLYICMGLNTDGTYKWVQVAKDVVDLSGYVKDSTTIAGLDLSGNISVMDLQKALSTYPIQTHMYEPPTTLKGEAGQLCVGYVMTESPKFYMCFGINGKGEYIWKLIGGGNDVDLSGYVPTTRTIANIDLADNITVDKLNDALGIVSKEGENLFEYSEDNLLVGYTTTGISIAGILDTLELSVDNTTNVKVADGYTLYRKIIPVIDNTTYSVSKEFVGAIRFYNSEGVNTKVISVTYSNPLPSGENSSLITIPDGVKYISLTFMDAGKIDYTTFKLVKGTWIVNETILNENIKVKYSQIIDAPDNGSDSDVYVEHLATKNDLKQATYGQPRTLSMFDYFGANKKVVLLGDSFTQGLGSTGVITYYKTDESGNELRVTGNSEEYGINNNLSDYQVGVKLYQNDNHIWYEAIDGNGYAQRLKNFLQNKFGCTVKNYGLSGFTSGGLLGQTMNSDNTDLDISGLPTDAQGNVRVFQGLTKGFDTVFITIGGNDRTMTDITAFIYNLNWIVNYLVNTDHKKVILMSMTPYDDPNAIQSMEDIDAAIKGVAETYNLPFVSCYQGILDYCDKTGIAIDTMINSDGLHPNDEGYAVVNSIVCEQLGINDVDKSYVDNALANFKISDEDKQDIANMVAQMMSAQSGGDSNV